MKNKLDRRTVLKGLGTVVALPFLEKMAPLSALAQSAVRPPTRMAFLFIPNGVNMEHWRPTGPGALQALPTTLAPLEPVKGSVSVLTGLTQRNAFALGDGPGDHARSTATWLTGVHPKKTAGTDISVGISADQVAAQKIGHLTKFASLEIGCERGAQAGNCDSGYSCAYSSNISWRSPTTPVAKEVNPRAVFERLFGSADSAENSAAPAKRNRERLSILDFVLEDASRLSSQLGLQDKRKLDEYLTSVREVELRLEKYEQEAIAIGGGMQKPSGTPSDYGEHIRLLGDMMVLAFQADLTRICTFMFANDGSNRPFRDVGVSEGHHDISHHGKDPDKLEKKRKIDRFYVDQLSYVLQRLNSIREGSGTLLDQCMVVFGGGISDGDRHNHDDLPILLCGKGGGTIQAGRHYVFANGTPMNNLFLSMLDRMKVPIESLGDSTGKLTELL